MYGTTSGVSGMSPPMDVPPGHGRAAWRRTPAGADRFYIVMAVAGFFFLACIVGLISGRFSSRRWQPLPAALTPHRL